VPTSKRAAKAKRLVSDLKKMSRILSMEFHLLSLQQVRIVSKILSNFMPIGVRVKDWSKRPPTQAHTHQLPVPLMYIKHQTREQNMTDKNLRINRSFSSLKGLFCGGRGAHFKVHIRQRNKGIIKNSLSTFIK
jgi:hypothetical protein